MYTHWEFFEDPDELYRIKSSQGVTGGELNLMKYKSVCKSIRITATQSSDVVYTAKQLMELTH